MTEKKTKTAGSIVRAVGKASGKSTAKGRSTYTRTIEVRQDELIELLEKALSEVGSNALTSIYNNEKGREDLIKLAECLTKTYSSEMATKKSTDPNSPRNMARREIEKKALEHPSKFEKHGDIDKFINDICQDGESYAYEGITVSRKTIANYLTELIKNERNTSRAQE